MNISREDFNFTELTSGFKYTPNWKITSITWEFLIFGIFLSIIQIYFSFYKKDQRLEEMLKKWPSPPGRIPIFGHIFNFTFINTKECIPKLHGWTQKYGGLFKAEMPHRSYFCIAKAEEAEKILSSKLHIEKGSEYELFRPMFGDSVVMSKGEKWLGRKKLLTSAFSVNLLQGFTEVFNRQTNTLCDYLNKKCLEGDEFDIVPYLERCSFDIISEAMLGLNFKSQSFNPATIHYIEAVNELNHINVEKLAKPWRNFKLIKYLTKSGKREMELIKCWQAFYQNIISERKEEFKLKNKNKISERKNLAFLDLLLDVSQDGAVLTDKDIIDETATFIFAGYDTISANLSWTLYLLAKNINEQKKVQEEIDEMFKDDKSRPITQKDLRDLKYLECCIKESLRLFPPGYFFARIIGSDLKLNEELSLPKGSNAVFNIYSLHRDPNVFKNPEDFIPERFLPENSKGRHPYAFLPFVGGVRHCMGQKFAILEAKVILAKILLNFHIESSEERKEIMHGVVLKPEGGVKIKLTKRF